MVPLITRSLAVLSVVFCLGADAVARGYTTYSTFREMIEGTNVNNVDFVRVSDPGTRANPRYTGFFFYGIQQYDSTGRYLLGMRVYFQGREPTEKDAADIGYIDLHNGNRWTQIGETTAWHWQQGCRLMWRPNSDEIVWNDRSLDGRQFISRTYNFKTGERRTLPRALYDISPDGDTALTHDFSRMQHGGTNYVGIDDPYKDECAPDKSGLWKMNMNTGSHSMIMSLHDMAHIIYGAGHPTSGRLYFFREGWNLSGTRFIVFVKDPRNKLDVAYSMDPNGNHVRFFYNRPSHHVWKDNEFVLEGRGYYLFRDDGTGAKRGRLCQTSQNGHVSYLSGHDWLVSDTYDISGYQYVFLYHIPTRLYVPLFKLRNHAPASIYRVDTHPRFSPNGKQICIDATFEDLGRQMYIADISHIIDNPPTGGVGGGGDNDLSIFWTQSGSDGSWTNLSYADDDDITTKAECPSSGTGHYIEYTLGGTYTLTSARMNEDDNGSKEVDDWMLEYYDGSWKSAFGWTSSTSATWQEVDFSDVSGATKVRVHFKNDDTIQVEEVEVYGTASSGGDSDISSS